jgi:amidophosphoribosyltransferase
MLIIEAGKPLRSYRPFGPQSPHRCVFEWVYFSRPDSTIAGTSVYRARENMGRRLAVEHGVDADVVIPVPDSGTAAAIGYARESGIPFGQGLMRSHYAGRTFIEPSQSIRHFGVKLKLSPVREVLAGKRVVVVDDSIVRGTTSRKIMEMIRAAGAREIHMRISSPPTKGSCHYGIDTPSSEELIASAKTVEDIRAFVAPIRWAICPWRVCTRRWDAPDPRMRTHGLCDACFSTKYPINVIPPARLRQLHPHLRLTAGQGMATSTTSVPLVEGPHPDAAALDAHVRELRARFPGPSSTVTWRWSRPWAPTCWSVRAPPWWATSGWATTSPSGTARSCAATWPR